MKTYLVVVDDDPDDQVLVVDAFRSSDFKHQIECVNNGEELFSILNERGDKNLPFLIIMDQNMPGKEGSEVVHQLKKNLTYKNIPVIVLTGSMLPKYAKDLYFFGASCVIHKPDSFEELKNITASIAKLWQPIRDR